MEEQVERVEEMKTNQSSWGRAATPGPQGPSTSIKYEGLATAKDPLRSGPPGAVGPGSLCDLLTAALMIGFWFGIGAILAIKMVNSLEELIS